MIPEPERVNVVVCRSCNRVRRPMHAQVASCPDCQFTPSTPASLWVVSDATLAPGERDRIVREAVVALVEEFEQRSTGSIPISSRISHEVVVGGQHKADVDWWRTKLAALGVAAEEKTG